MSAVDSADEYGKLKDKVDLELVKILLNAGAAVNPGEDESPLGEAVDRGHLELVDLLISVGANVNFNTEASLGFYRSSLLFNALEQRVDIPRTEDSPKSDSRWS